MADDLRYYYERELAYLRRAGADFARRYPKIAGRLELEETEAGDPHVERLLEGVAFLAARVHHKIDEDFPEISEALLDVLYPQYVRPVPSISLAQFHLDPDQGKLTSGLEIPSGTELYTRPVDGTPCKFRTCYDTTLWPLEVTDAGWVTPQELHPPVRAGDAVAALRVEMAARGDMSLEELEIENLRFHLRGEGNLATTLYELLADDCLQILLRDPDGGPASEPVVLPPSALRPVGFEEDEGVLPAPRQAFLPYRLLTEYFVFPEKYLFFDLSGLDRVARAGFGQRLEMVFLVGSFERPERGELLETGVDARTLRLGCSPIVNLFEKTSEPVLFSQRKQEYPLVADARRRDAVATYAVNEVIPVTPGGEEPVPFVPFHSLRHGGADDRVYWYAKRRLHGVGADEGTDLFLSFVDLSGRTVHPDLDAVTARVTCHNGDLPGRLPLGEAEGDFELPGGGPVSKVVALTRPTDVVQPPLGRAQLWRLISQLALNYVSLIEGDGEALREVLRLHDFAGTRAAEQQIEGIVGLASEPSFARIESEHGLTFARGHRVELDLDEEKFAGGGVYLFASVLERFLALCVSMNSFVRLTARSRQREGILKEWAPRAGHKRLL